MMDNVQTRTITTIGHCFITSSIIHYTLSFNRMPHPHCGYDLPLIPVTPAMTAATPTTTHSVRAGVLYGLSAYLWWGFIALYFKLIAHVHELSVLSSRIVWSVGFLALILTWRAHWSQVKSALLQRRTLGLLALGSLLIAGNWFVFIFAVNRGQLLQSSLGYYINPLLSVLLGTLVLRERLRRVQWVCFLLALIGVIIAGIAAAALPWIALTLATSFALYGLVRKLVRVDAVVGLFVETSILFPLAFAWLYLTWSSWTINITLADHGLLALAGIVTALPLLWFAQAAQRLRLSTLGFMQYIAPSVQFLVAVFLLHEPMNKPRLLSFAFIWLALLIFSIDSWRAYRKPPGEVVDISG